MVHEELGGQTSQAEDQSVKENQEPARAISKAHGKKMANSSKHDKVSGKVKILKQKNSTCAQNKDPATKSSPRGQDVKTSEAPKVNNRSLKAQKEKAGEEVKKATEVKKAAEVKKAKQLFPPLVPKASDEPTHSKLEFQAPVKESLIKRRLSIPYESFHHKPHKPILKKRNSICTDIVQNASGNALGNAAAFWSIPWERETYFPNIGPKGLLLFHDEAMPVPPVQRRLSLVTKYSYSQEFMQALSDLQSRPSSRHESPLMALATQPESEGKKKPLLRKMSKLEHYATRHELQHPAKSESTVRHLSE